MGDHYDKYCKHNQNRYDGHCRGKYDDYYNDKYYNKHCKNECDDHSIKINVNCCDHKKGPIGPTGPCQSGLLHQFVVGTNANPLPELPLSPTSAFSTISTLTIAIDDPLDTVRFLATIEANNLGSSVATQRAQLITYRIRRIAPEAVIINVQDTNIDIATTTFTAIDRPGVGFFTYVLEGRVLTTTLGNNNNEMVLDAVFTAEEIENNIPC
ncbi:hypothetical protein COE15_27860 [Bacillus cereus]|uniref:hypothetical protein n=1 Tax=Bacillus sp. AFS023182 TaxID=2033492 RepID=UPI000BF4AC58|nr:hypothetical protein [Bacillus sp. AFS023182]PFE03297.1 hypothetical protein CN288_13700 [Bacillus sp. AFS023182]PGX89549.1 hypothetical protein COE15_27860 [Bacillus cereus]